MNVYFDRKPSILHAYADYISQFPWDLYSTITYREPRKDCIYQAQRAFGVLEKFGATRAVIAVEPHRLSGVHLHCLSRHLPALDSTVPLWKYCFKAFGRTTVESVGDTLAVSRYCAKYVVKENNVSFAGSPEAWLQDP